MRSQARQHTLPKRVRYPTGCSFASSCFPPRLAGDAVTLSYAWRDYHAAGTSTLLTQRPHGRTTAGLRPALAPLPHPLHQVGDALGDHDGRRVGVGARDRGHDRGVADAQALDAPHLTAAVGHGELVVGS